MKKKQTGDDVVLVVGLGCFGTAVASTLDGLGREVFAIEHDPVLVQQWSHRFRIIENDTTSADALGQTGAHEFGVIVVSIGNSLETSVLVTASLADLGMKQIWAKATSRSHGRILRCIGAHRVVYPEYDVDVRVTHVVNGRMLDYIGMEDGFSITKMYPPRGIQGLTVTESRVCERFGVIIIDVKAPGQSFEYATEGAKIGPEDVIIVFGDSALLEKFANH